MRPLPPPALVALRFFGDYEGIGHAWINVSFLQTVDARERGRGFLRTTEVQPISIVTALARPPLPPFTLTRLGSQNNNTKTPKIPRIYIFKSNTLYII